MKDYEAGVDVAAEKTDAGSWTARCPECGMTVKAMTNEGINAALCAHMNDWHFIPPRGNA